MGELGPAENVGEGLLNMVVVESLVLPRLLMNSIVGVGKAWKAVNVLDNSSSCKVQIISD